VKSLGVDLNTLEQADIDDQGNRAHVDVYLALRSCLQVHMQSGAHPILEESVVPRGGYEAAAARGGMMAATFQSNLEFEKFQEASRHTYGPVVYQTIPDGWEYVGDAGEDRGWMTRQLGI
jgi:hypothetical protein